MGEIPWEEFDGRNSYHQYPRSKTGRSRTEPSRKGTGPNKTYEIRDRTVPGPTQNGELNRTGPEPE